MSPTDKGGSTPETPENPEIPEPNGENSPANHVIASADYPAPESFASAKPAGGANKKLIAIIAAVVVAIIAIAAILFVVLKDDSVSAEQQIKNTTEKFVAAANSGKADDSTALLCQAVLDQFGADLQDEPPAEQPVRIIEFGDITIDGDTAISNFTLAVGDQPDTAGDVTYLKLVDEDGWKVCN